MANLTDTLGTVTRGRETEQPTPSAPSIFATLAGGASDALQAQTSADQVVARRAAQARAAASANREAITFSQQQGDRAANEAAATAIPNIFYGVDTVPSASTPTPDENTDASKAATGVAGEIAGYQTAAGQGRITPQMAEVRTQATIRALMRQFPNSAAAIMTTLKEQGVTNIMTREYDRAAKAVDAQDASVAEADKAIANYAITNLGADYYRLPPDKQAEVRSLALEGMKSDAIEKQLQVRSQIQKDNSAITKDQIDLTEKTAGKQTQGIIANQLNNSLWRVQQTIGLIMADPSMSPLDKEKQISQALAVVQNQGDLMFSNMLTKYSQTLTPESTKFVTDLYQGYKKNLTDLLTGPYSEVQTSTRQLQILQNNLGIQMNQALPIFSQLKTALGPAALGALLQSDAFRPNSPMMSALQKELSGLPNLTSQEGTVRINNIVSILEGKTGIKDYTPEQARAMAPHILKTMIGAVNDEKIRTGVDTQGYGVALNAIGAVSNVAIEANPQWGVRDLSQMMTVMTGQNLGNTLIGPGGQGNPDRGRTVDAYMAGLQKTYLALSKARESDPYYDKVWNKASGQWEIKRNSTPFPTMPTSAVVGSDVYSIPGNVTPKPAGPSEEIRNQVTALNRGVSALSVFGKQGWDGSIPINKVSDLERRNYYGAGAIPASVREEVARRKEEAVRLKSNRENLSDIITNSLTQTAEMTPTPAVIDSITGSENSSGNPAAKNPRSSAQGDGQFINSTWLNLMKTNRPDLTAGKTDSAILEMKTDPTLSRQMTGFYARDNARVLAAKGLNASVGNLNLMHLFGPGEGPKVIAAAPTTKVDTLVSAQTLEANPWMKGKTVAEIRRIRKAPA